MGITGRSSIITNTGGFFDNFPSALNTGPVPGTVLTPSSGVVFSSADNQIIENLFLNPGSIQVTHNNVIVRNCVINGTGCNFNGPIGQLNAIGGPQTNTNVNLRVLHCKIYSISNTSKDQTQLFDGVSNAIEIGFCDIAGCENAIDNGFPACGAAYIHDNYLHDFQAWDATQAPPDGSHCDGLQTFDISNTGGMTIYHNTVLGLQTAGTFPPALSGTSSCIALITGQHDLTVDFNLFAGGSYCMYGPSQNSGGGHPVNVKVRGNHFSTCYYPNGGAFGTHAGWDNTAVGWEWSGNVWHDGPNYATPVNVLPWPN